LNTGAPEARGETRARDFNAQNAKEVDQNGGRKVSAKSPGRKEQGGERGGKKRWKIGTVQEKQHNSAAAVFFTSCNCAEEAIGRGLQAGEKGI